MMFFSFEPVHHHHKEIIEMEDVDIDDDDENFAERYKNQNQNQNSNNLPAANAQVPLFKIEPRKKNHINAAAKIVMNEGKTKSKADFGSMSPTPNQNKPVPSAYPMFTKEERPEIKPRMPVARNDPISDMQFGTNPIEKPVQKPKIRGRLLGNLTGLLPKQQTNSNESQQPLNVPDRKRGMLNAEPKEREQIPTRKLMQNDGFDDPFANDMKLPPIDGVQNKPRTKLLGSLF